LAAGPDDLLVIGVRPRRWHHRPVHRHVRRHARCPVLTVPLRSARRDFRALRRMAPGDFCAL
ncbi:universal stress protein, partial [Streptomyces sp. SID14478]|nr:universal stress protein [Streptomyces sp. SID14478]